MEEPAVAYVRCGNHDCENHNFMVNEMKQREEIREVITALLESAGQMPKKDLVEMVYARLTVTQAEIRAEWSEMKKEGLVYCVRDMPGWVGIY
ncbi:hypothetical protein D4758_30670 [Enterocloster citroniae]|nr:hypothetical protein [Enterocloster citroniae]